MDQCVQITLRDMAWGCIIWVGAMTALEFLKGFVGAFTDDIRAWRRRRMLERQLRDAATRGRGRV
jgi:hypothetical protein